MTDNTTPTDEPSDDKIEALEARVAELEAMTEVDSADDGGLSLPDLLDLGLTRRQALMAIALVGAGWQLGPAITKSISEPAAASHGGADLGTEENPLGEVYIEDLYSVTDNVVADSVSTEQATIGETDPYEYVSESHTLVNVPGDYDTIQAAIDDCPKNLRHRYVIEVDNGTYDEDLVIRGISHQGTTNASSDLGGGVGTAGELGLLQIVGDRSNPSNVSVNSLAALACTGVGSPMIWGISFSGDESPEVDESACVIFSGCQQSGVGDCEVLDGTANQGVLAYGGQVHVRDTDLNTTTGISGKRGARIHARSTSGNTTNRFRLSEASICHTGPPGSLDASDLTFGDASEGSFYLRDDNGPVYDGGWLHMDSGTAALNENQGNAEFRLRDAVNGVLRFRAAGKGFGNSHIENLSGQNGDFDGQERLDDGTNTPHRATKCVWDDVNGVWVDQTDGSTFS